MHQLDLKDLPAGRSTPVLGHLRLVSVTAGALLATYVLLNALSASTNESLETIVRAESAGAVDSPDGGFALTGFARTAAKAEHPGGAEEGGDGTALTPRQPEPFNPHAESMTLASLALPRSQPTDSRRQSARPGDASSEPHDDRAAVANEAESSSPPPAAAIQWRTATVQRRDTLSRIFARHGVKVGDAYAAVQLPAAAPLRKIHPGQEIQLAANSHGALAALRYRLDAFSTLRITREDSEDGKLTAEVITRTPEVRLRGARATISTSLLGATEAAGLDFETVYALALIFGWQVDFAREIRSGDQFSVIFEELYVDGEKAANGDILAAELLVSNRRLQAVRHIDERGRTTYYAPNGDGIQRSFLRSPIKFGRVTSNFSHRRFHPILKKWRAHRGVDYGAPTGTPVRSTGDGVVTQVRRKRGYGKLITIRHGLRYTTLYAHLKGFARGIRPGARVKQGEVIGYVGSTGWATGPHLHYEFRVDGAHQNPLTVALPKSAPIAEAHKPAFLAEADGWTDRLAQIGETTLAQIDFDADFEPREPLE